MGLQTTIVNQIIVLLYNTVICTIKKCVSETKKLDAPDVI